MIFQDIRQGIDQIFFMFSVEKLSTVASGTSTNSPVEFVKTRSTIHPGQNIAITLYLYKLQDDMLTNYNGYNEFNGNSRVLESLLLNIYMR